MDDKVISLNGKPLPPEVNYDRGLLDILERATVELKTGSVVGIGVIWVTKTEGSFDIDVSYQGPRLSLLAAANRMQHRLNLALDKDVVHPT